eukprot:GFUD01138390.1.p1 GENE.GFUD01138390.1~~GFUD01138390.1.p1  ORF type:complete len:111 (-),score=10.82 GFUD01138390.1:95-427(-)
MIMRASIKPGNLVVLLVCLQVLFLGPVNSHSVRIMRSVDKDLLFNGIYYYESKKNAEPYLIELGIGWLLRKLALASSPTITVSRNCDVVPCSWMGGLCRLSSPGLAGTGL